MSVEFFDHGDQDVDAQWRAMFANRDHAASLAACYAIMPHSIAHGIEQAASRPMFSAAAERRRARVGYGGLNYERLAW